MEVFRNGRNALDTCYAGKKRRRPAKRTTVAPDANVKSNPSKRHRERLNAELEKLAQLLPFDEDTISRLDKLSILRLCVSYLRNKSFFQVALASEEPNGNEVTVSSDGGSGCQPSSTVKCLDKSVSEVTSSSTSNIHLDKETEMLLQALNGFIIVVEPDGEIFYTSPSISDFLGFQNVDVMHQNVFELIHKEDRVDFQDQLALKPLSPEDPEKAQLSDVESSLERNFFCRFRCLLDESSGFLNLHFTGKLRPMFGQRTRGEDGIPVDIDPPKLGLFALACPLQQPSIMEIYVRNMIFRTKHQLDFKPQTLDSKGSEILGFSEDELSSLNGYNYLHYEDIIYCSEMHSQLMRKGETRFIYFRLMTKRSKWLWVQAKGRVIYKNGKPDALVSTHRPMSDEEGEQYLANRGAPFKFPFEGPAELYDCNPPLPPIPKEILQGMTMGEGGPPGGPPMGGPPMSRPPMNGPLMNGPMMGHRMSGLPKQGPAMGLSAEGKMMGGFPAAPRNSPPLKIESPIQQAEKGIAEHMDVAQLSSGSDVGRISHHFESSYGSVGPNSHKFAQKIPIPEPAMVERVMNKDLAEALKNIHFEDSIENISGSDWSKEYQEKVGLTNGPVQTQQPQITLKYSPGNSPQCSMQLSQNGCEQLDVQAAFSCGGNSNQVARVMLKTEASPFSRHSDSGVDSDEAKSDIHIIEEELVHLETQWASRRGPLESTDSVESGLDIPELDVSEFEGTEIDLDEVLNMIDGVDTSTPDLNIPKGQRLSDKRNGQYPQREVIHTSFSPGKETHIVKTETDRQSKTLTSHQNCFPQTQVVGRNIYNPERTLLNERQVCNGHTVVSYRNDPSQQHHIMSSARPDFYSTTSSRHGNEVPLHQDGVIPTSDVHGPYQTHQASTIHNLQGYSSQYSQPVPQQRQEQMYFQRSQQMAVSMNPQQVAHVQQQQSHMFPQQQHPHYMCPPTSSSSSQEAVISPVQSNFLPNIEDRYEARDTFLRNDYASCFKGPQNGQFTTLQSEFPWEANDNPPNLSLRRNAGFQVATIIPSL